MLKFFVLLISFLFFSVAHAELETSGYVFATTFSNQDWFKNRSTAGYNIDWYRECSTCRFAFRTQLTTAKDDLVRRAVVEYAFTPMDKLEVVMQAGRFGRLESFYKSPTDNPASYGMAILPQGGYPYRYYSPTFLSMDGVQASASYRTGAVLTTLRVAHGKNPVGSKKEIVDEFFGSNVAGIGLQGDKPVWDVGLHAETEHWHAYTSLNTYKFKSVLHDATDPTAQYLASTYSKVDVTLHRSGIKYDTNKWWAQLEWFHSMSGAKTNYDDSYTPTGDSDQWSWVAGYRITDAWSVYASRSFNKQNLEFTTAQDNFIGVAYNQPKYAVAVDFHKGNGVGWHGYSSPASWGSFSALPADRPRWNSIVMSLTYRF